MKRLSQENLNDPLDVARVFKERWREQVHYIDWERFKKLIKYFSGGKYLDVGCFNSPMPYELATDKKYQAEVYALDSCKEVVDTLQARFPEVNYMVGDCMRLPDKQFDYIVAGELIEHLESPQDFIKESVRVLKPGGILALSTPLNEAFGQISKEHLWSFSDNDIIDLLSPYGEVELTHYQDTTQVIIAFLKKYE